MTYTLSPTGRAIGRILGGVQRWYGGDGRSGGVVEGGATKVVEDEDACVAASAKGHDIHVFGRGTVCQAGCIEGHGGAQRKDENPP
jgi:hypothetical protein